MVRKVFMDWDLTLMFLFCYIQCNEKKGTWEILTHLFKDAVVKCQGCKPAVGKKLRTKKITTGKSSVYAGTTLRHALIRVVTELCVVHCACPLV